MSHTKAIGRRSRVLRRANDRAQRRFHAMFDAHIWHDPDARETRLYVEAERLVDAVMEPESHALPVVTLEEILHALGAGYTSKIDEYQTRGA